MQKRNSTKNELKCILQMNNSEFWKKVNIQ